MSVITSHGCRPNGEIIPRFELVAEGTQCRFIAPEDDDADLLTRTVGAVIHGCFSRFRIVLVCGDAQYPTVRSSPAYVGLRGRQAYNYLLIDGTGFEIPPVSPPEIPNQGKRLVIIRRNGRLFSKTFSWQPCPKLLRWRPLLRSDRASVFGSSSIWSMLAASVVRSAHSRSAVRRVTWHTPTPVAV